MASAQRIEEAASGVATEGGAGSGLRAPASHPLLALQRAIGNTSVGLALDPVARAGAPSVRIQRKCAACSVGAACGGCGPDDEERPDALQRDLEVSRPGDADEEEADRIAADAFGAHGGDRAPAAPGGSAQIQRKPSANAEALASTAGVDFASLRAGGAPLPERTRELMESRIGYDFSAVRVHDGPSAARAAAGLSARAFTFGRDVVFGRGQYSPETRSGQALLAHELVHVVQQGEARERSGPAPGSVTKARSGAVQRQPVPNPRPNVIEMRRPPFFPQPALTCWASSIGAWRAVKGMPPPVTDAALIAQYRGTGCVDSTGALAGAGNIQDVFGEHRLLLDLAAQIDNAHFTVDFVRSTILNHGHFVLVWGFGATLHAVVVYGFQVDATDPEGFNLFIMDPMADAGMPRDPAVAGDRTLHRMFVPYPVAIAVGLPRSAGPAPCGRRPAAAAPP